MVTKKFQKPIISFFMLMAGICFTEGGAVIFNNGIVRLAWFILAFLPVGLGVMREAWECAMKKEVFSEFMLMTIASIGAFIIGEYPEAVAVMLFYCVGETLQDMAVDKARDNIRSLMEFHPKMAVIVRGNHKVADKPENVIPGEIIEVKPGERVPLDGILTSGDAAFNTAALTGESMPRTIENGHEVLAGMIATESVARIKVTRPDSESAVARILKMVEEASERKAPAELFIRKFARIYTPCRNRAGSAHRHRALHLVDSRHRLRLRLQHMVLPRTDIPRYIVPLRPRHKHTAELFRRHRRGIKARHTVQGRQLARRRDAYRHRGVRQDGHADARSVLRN